MKKNTERQNEVNPIADLITQMLGDGQLKTGLTKVRIQDYWREQMGEGVYTYTKDITLKGQTLIVYLTSSVIRQELSYGTDKIIKIINESLGDQVINKVILR